VIADWLALDTSSHVVGIHANAIAFRHHGATFGSGDVAAADATPEESVATAMWPYAGFATESAASSSRGAGAS
jgi:hypothetical protein